MERLVFKKVLLAYDDSIEGRRALREGAKVAQLSATPKCFCWLS
jgi:hypothetical protein